MYLLCFDSILKIKGIFEISHGGISQAVIDPKNIFSRALLVGATGITLVHNHPAGSLIFTQADDIVTNEINAVCKILHIRFLDHIIIGNGYVSARELARI